MKSCTDQYIEYLHKHIKNVSRGWNWIREHLSEVVTDELKTLQKIMCHDESKFSDEEFDAYREYFYGEHSFDQEDPVVNEKFDVAWNVHQKRNPHHWQYWVLLKDDGSEKYIDIPNECIIEMICDWWSFSWAEDNLYEIFKWYDSHKSDIRMSDNSREELENILNLMEKKLKELE